MSDLFDQLETLAKRDFPAATRLFGVEHDGLLSLDYADGADDTEESFYAFANDTRRIAADSWSNAQRGLRRRGRWELFQDWSPIQGKTTWVLVL